MQREPERAHLSLRPHAHTCVDAKPRVRHYDSALQKQHQRDIVTSFIGTTRAIATALAVVLPSRDRALTSCPRREFREQQCRQAKHEEEAAHVCDCREDRPRCQGRILLQSPQ